ncbi:MAG: hypothetical protein ACI8UO_005726 [Verrucomicrobiales bacterium]|jgi:hypothetical protein
MDWYYEHTGTQLGPISESELSRLVQSGAVTGATRVWNETLTDWSPLSTVAPHLVPAVPAHASPPPASVQNPYQTPNFYPNQLGIGVRFPGFVKGWMITDIVFCSFNLITICGFFANEGDGLELLNLLFTVLLGGLGLTAAIMILKRKPSGVPMAWTTLAMTVVHIFFQLLVVVKMDFRNTPEFQDLPFEQRDTLMAFVIGALIAVCIVRFVLLIFYGVAVKRASAWFRRNSGAA